MPTFRDDLHLGHSVPMVDTEDIVDGAITEPKLADDSVSTRTIQDGAVTEPKIAEKAVTEPKLADAAVSTRTIKFRAVTESKIGDSAVSTRTIQNGAVTNPKIANGAVSMNKLDNETQTLIQRGADSSWTPRGDFNIETTYDANDVVFDPVTNSSYLSLRADNTGHPVDENDEEYEEGWWMKVLDGSYVNRAIEEMEAAIAQAIEDAQEDISELISDSQATIDTAVSGANSAAQSANTAAQAATTAKNTLVTEISQSLAVYETVADTIVTDPEAATGMLPVQNYVLGKAIVPMDNYIHGDVRTLAVGQTYTLDEAVKTSDNIIKRMLKEVKTMNTTDVVTEGDLKAENDKTWKALLPILEYSSTGDYSTNPYALGRPSICIITVDVSGLTQGGDISVTIGGVPIPNDITVTTESTAASITAAIVSEYAEVDIPGWSSLTDNGDGTIKITCLTAGANTLAFTFTDTDETGVLVEVDAEATKLGASTVSKYENGAWSAVTVQNMYEDENLYDEVSIETLISTYTIQDSVRYQFGSLFDAIDITPTFTKGKYYTNTSNKSVGYKITSFSTSNKGNSWCAIMNCTVGEVFSITGRCIDNYIPLVCFISSDNVILSQFRGAASTGADTFKDGIWVAPEGATRVIIQTNSILGLDNKVYKVGRCSDIEDKLDYNEFQLETHLDKYEFISFTGGRYYDNKQLIPHVGGICNLTGLLNHTFNSVAIVECSEGDVFHINLTAYTPSTCCAFLDSDDRVLYCTGKSALNTYVVAPKGTVKVIFHGTARSGATVYTQRVHKMYNLKEVLTDYIDNTRHNITYWQTGTYRTIPDVGQEMNYTLTSSNSLLHQDVACVGGDVFYLSVSNSGTGLGVSPLIFVDSNNIILWKSLVMTRPAQYYQAPKGAVKMICQTNVGSDTIYKIGKIEYGAQGTDSLLGRNETWRFYNNKGYLEGVQSKPVGETITDYTTVTRSAYSRYALFECSSGNYISGDQNIDGTPWSVVFIDGNDVILNRTGGTGRLVSAVAPTGTVKCYVSVQPLNNNEIASLFNGGKINALEYRLLQMEKGLDYPYDIVCPDVFYAVAGYQKNIYKDTVIQGMDDGLNSPMGLIVGFECPSFNHQGYTNVGIRRPRMWQLKGNLLSSHTGSSTFRINVLNQKGVNISSKNCTIKVVPATPLAESKNIICVGDSLTAGGQVVAACRSRFVELGGVTPAFWGSRSSIVDGVTVKHEGVSGKEWGYFSGSSSPFYIGGKLDIAAYRNTLNMGDEKFDLVIFMLGVNNSVLGHSPDMSSAVTIINAFLADNPDTKFIVQLQPADNNTTDGWEVYASDSLNTGIKESYKNHTWNARRAALTTFNNSTWDGIVYIGDAVMGLDRYYGYPYEETASSARISVTEIRHTNCVHPNDAGYKQLGDGYFYQALAILSGNA